MRGMERRASIVLVFLVLSASDCLGALRAGIAVRIVTPDPLLPVSGGVGPSDPATRQEGELTVRALVIEQDGVRVAIVSADFLGFPAALGNRVRAAVRGVPPQNILIGATHTHSAPDCYGFPDENGQPGSNPAYLDTVCSRMAEAINEALNKLTPVTVRMATGEARGRIAYNYYAEQLYDPRCHVIQFLGEEGKPYVTLVNYAIHPEVIGSDQRICSPDLIGPLYDRIAEKGGGTGLFMNSAQGGMVTPDNRRPEGGEARDYAECRRIGHLLADEALRIIQDAPVQASPRLSCCARQVSFPVESPLFRELLKTLPRTDGYADGTVTTQVNLIHFGEAQILTIPGEALPNIGYYLKRKMRGRHNLLFGLTNDAFGYILTKEDFDSFKRYAYITKTSLGEHTGEILVNESLALLNECPPPAAEPSS